MPPVSKKKVIRPVIDAKETGLPTFYCRKCQKTYTSKTKFYDTTNPYLDSNGVMSVCKDCAKSIFKDYFVMHNEYTRALFETCRELDICFSYTAFDMGYAHYLTMEKRGTVDVAEMLGYYLTKLNSFNTKSSKVSKGRFKDSDNFKYDSDNSTLEITPAVETPEEEMKRLTLMWGKGKDEWEYAFLEEELMKIQSSFACEDYGMELIQKDIAYLNLAIEKDRQKNGDAQKLIEMRAKLMQDAKMKPVQASGIESNDAITFGTLIKKWENEKPIPVYLDDEMMKYIDTYFVGQISKMEGVENEYTAKMDKDLEKFTIDFENLNIIDDETDNLSDEDRDKVSI